MKFFIRDLLLVTVIVAVCVAWWLDHRRQAQEIERLTPTTIDFTFLLDDKALSLKRLRELQEKEIELMAELKRLKYERDALNLPDPNPSTMPTLRFPPESDYQAPVSFRRRRAHFFSTRHESP
jgi:hypothetical protein